MLRLRPFWILALLLLLAPALARAGPAFPWWSDIDARLIQCPAGDLAFHVLARRLDTPQPNATLVVDFCAATGARLADQGQPAEVHFLGACLPAVQTDAQGLATFALRAGGGTADSSIEVTVDGVHFCRRFLTSPDQDGDLSVTVADEAILAAKLGGGDPSADFDADGVVTTTDLEFLRAHLGHTAERATATAAETWGGIKLRYR